MNLLNDNQINKFMGDNHICPHCGGVMRMVEDNTDNFELYTYDVCNDCGYEEK